MVSELRFWRYDPAAGGGEGGGGGSWSLERSLKDEGYKVVSASGVNPDESDDIWITTDGFTQPPTLSLATASAPTAREPLKSLPAFYEAAGLQTQQLFATSADGTKVPYFLVSRKVTLTLALTLALALPLTLALALTQPGASAWPPVSSTTPDEASRGTRWCT